ncbi:pentraxin fusion protein-like [Ostrea edulis]|uniref:pentraxin fusion protein-like n=1 Tax=Ostrea edulis TaxID=37623 RepID=UPI0024AF96CD|nr:pentraxin fusion protein-like [Ostrea edulis]
MSSVFVNGIPLVSEFAVDNDTECKFNTIAATRHQMNPWIQIDLGLSAYVLQVLIHARQDCCEPGRLHNVSITVADVGHQQECGFYPGPTNAHDRILVFCKQSTRGRYVTLMIHSRPGACDLLQVCEIQIYGHR